MTGIAYLSLTARSAPPLGIVDACSPSALSVYRKYHSLSSYQSWSSLSSLDQNSKRAALSKKCSD